VSNDDILAGVRALRERIIRAVNVTAVSEDKDLLLAMADVVEEALGTRLHAIGSDGMPPLSREAEDAILAAMGKESNGE
jgi:hypothetical protein